MDIDYERAAFPRDAALDSLRQQYDQLIALADQLQVVLDTGDGGLWVDEQTLALHKVSARIDAATALLRREQAAKDARLRLPGAVALVRPLRAVDTIEDKA